MKRDVVLAAGFVVGENNQVREKLLCFNLFQMLNEN